MNYKLFCALSLLSIVSIHNVVAMEKEDTTIEMPRTKMVELRAFFDTHDPKKYYSSNDIKEILPTFKTIVAKAYAEQNSREAGALAVVTGCSFNIKGGWSPTNIDIIPSLAIVKRYGLKTNVVDDTFPSQQKELAENDIKEYVLNFDQIGIVRTISDKMNKTFNIHEIVYGNAENRKDLVDALNKLDQIYKNSGITIKGRSLDSVMQEVFNDSNN